MRGLGGLLWISTSMFVSVILGAVIFALLGVYLPDALDACLNVGDMVADWIYHLEFISTKVRNVIRFLIDAQQMVYLFFVIVSRMVLAGFGMLFQR